MKKYRDLDLTTRLRIYNHAMELRRQGFGAIFIRKIIQEKFGISVGTATVNAWINHGIAPVREHVRRAITDDTNLKLTKVKKYQELSLEGRIKLYEEALHLASMGYKPSSIATILKLRHGVEIIKQTVRGWIYQNCRPRRTNMRPPINLMPSRELAVIAANSISDGSVTKEMKPRFSTQMKDHEPVELIIDCLEKITSFRYKHQYCPSVGTYYIASGRRALCEYLRNEDNILNLLHRFPREFIRMFFEAEGSPIGTIVKQSRQIGSSRTTLIFAASISASNNNIKLLKEIQNELRNFGIRSSIRMKSKAGEIRIIRGREVRFNKPCYELAITCKDSITRYGEEIGFISKRKREKLDDIIDILEKYGRSKEGAVEWIRRYEYRRRGRERWIKRESPLTYEEAISELMRLVRERLKNETVQVTADAADHY